MSGVTVDRSVFEYGNVLKLRFASLNTAIIHGEFPANRSFDIMKPLSNRHGFRAEQF